MTVVLEVEARDSQWTFDPNLDPIVRFGRHVDGIQLLGDDGRPDQWMSRHVGTFLYRGEVWWAENPPAADPHRPRATLVVLDLSDRWSTLSPGQALRLPPTGELRFSTRSEHDYWLRFRCGGPAGHQFERALEPDGAPRTHSVELSPREVDMLVALAEPELFGALAARRPGLSEVATGWHLSQTAVEKTLQNARRKLEAAGQLIGQPGALKGKTAHLVNGAVSLGYITVSDWRWAFGGPDGQWRPAADGPRFADGGAKSDDG